MNRLMAIAILLSVSGVFRQQQPYRFDHPVIIFVGKPEDTLVKTRKAKFIAVEFNSSQSIILDFANGDMIGGVEQN